MGTIRVLIGTKIQNGFWGEAELSQFVVVPVAMNRGR
jgi:hypothetical protein